FDFAPRGGFGFDEAIVIGFQQGAEDVADVAFVLDHQHLMHCLCHAYGPVGGVGAVAMPALRTADTPMPIDAWVPVNALAAMGAPLPAAGSVNSNRAPCGVRR